MSIYPKILRLIELFMIVSLVMIGVNLLSESLLGKESVLTTFLPIAVGVFVLVWRVRVTPEFREWGQTYEQRISEYSSKLSEDRLNSSRRKNDTLDGLERGALRGHMNSKIIDFTSFVIGPIMCVYGLLSFVSVDTVFMYRNDSKFLIAAGVGLTAFGIVRRKWK